MTTHKATINLKMLDSKELWPMIHNANTKYAASRVDTTTIMKYFNNGITLYTYNDFRKKFKEQSDYEPLTNWVIAVSLSGEIQPNKNNIIRSRNRTMLIASVDLVNVTEQGQVWPDPGTALDPKMITYIKSYVNYRDGGIQIHTQLPDGMDLKETVYDFQTLLNKYTDPALQALEEFRKTYTYDPYTTDEGNNHMYSFITLILERSGVFNPTAQLTRERIAQLLLTNKDIYGYNHKGVVFENENAYLAKMVAYGNNEEYVLRLQNDRPIMEKLLAQHPNDHMARLKGLDLSIINRPYTILTFEDGTNHSTFSTILDFGMGLTDDELGKVTKDTADYYQDLVIQRWHEVHQNRATDK